jgi:hypothetical protein
MEQCYPPIGGEVTVENPLFLFVKVLIFGIILLLPLACHSAVLMDDGLCIVNRGSMLKAETKKGIFKKGGVVVEFFVNGRSIGKALSGGDGIAYKAHTFNKRGLKKIEARVAKGTVEETTTAKMLCLEQGQEILLIDIETLRINPFSSIPIKFSKEVLKRLSRRFPIVYVQTGPGSRKEIEEWLSKNGYPSAPLLGLYEGLFSDILDLGLRIRAVVGTEKVVEMALSHGLRAITFEDIEGTVEVNSWLEIEKKLL